MQQHLLIPQISGHDVETSTKESNSWEGTHYREEVPDIFM